jgi:uncharacterized membrane protein
LINIEGGWQIGYLIEQLNKNWVVVFLPQAPSPMSGNVMYMPVARTGHSLSFRIHLVRT